MPANSSRLNRPQPMRMKLLGLLSTCSSASGMAKAISMAKPLGSSSRPEARPWSWYLAENIARAQVRPTLTLIRRQNMSRFMSRANIRVSTNSTRPMTISRRWPMDIGRLSLHHRLSRYISMKPPR
ncbi:hypothetical protein D3C86_1670330 [compost metagenome]